MPQFKYTIGQRIRDRRRELGLVTGNFNASNSISAGTLSAIENDKYTGNAVQYMQALTRLLPMLQFDSLDQLLVGVDYTTIEEEPAIDTVNGFTIKEIEKIRKMIEDAQ